MWEKGKIYFTVGRLLAVAIGILIATSVDVSAQESKQSKSQQTKPSRQPAGLTWTKLCRKVNVAGQAEGAAGKTVNVCRVFRERLNPTTGSPLMSVAVELRSDTNARTLDVTVPLGADLRSGVQATIDGGEPIRLSYARCTSGGCIATVGIASETVNALKAGQQLVLTGAGPGGRKVSIALPLSGFTAAYGGAPGNAEAYKEMRARFVKGIRADRAARVNKALKTLRSEEQNRPQAPPPVPPPPPLGGPPLEIETQP